MPGFPPAHLALALVLAGLSACLSAGAQEATAVPAGWETTVIADCADASVFSAGRTPDRPEFAFDAWELSPTTSARVRGESLRWHVRPRAAGAREARLTWAEAVRAPFDAISLHVKNPNGHELRAHLELLDADGVRYASPPVDLATERNWRQIIVRRTEFTAERPDLDPSPGIDVPALCLSLVIAPLAPGRPHTIYVDEVAGHRAPVPEVQVLALEAPTSLGPGEPVRLQARLRPRESLPAGARLSARLISADGGRPATAPLSLAAPDAEGVVRATAPELRVPAWLGPGRYELRLASDDVRLEGAVPVALVVAGTAPGAVKATLDLGTRPPRFALDGRTLAPVVRELRGHAPRSLPADAELVAIPATTDRHPWGWAPDAEGPDGALDASLLDARVAAALDAAPRAAIILQVFLDSTPAWRAAHPGDLVRFGAGTVAPPEVFARARSAADIVSPTWQAAVSARLYDLVTHVERAPWGHRVIGYELLAGDLGAWRPLGSALGLGERSTPEREQAFRRWAIAHYAGVERFRDAWLGQRRGLTGVLGANPPGFEGLRVPPPLEAGAEPSLYDPATDRPMIDWQQFQAEAQAQALLASAEQVRAATGGRKLVGACYGHMIAQSLEPGWRWPHLAPAEVLADPRLDFLTGPWWGAHEPPVPGFPADSARAAGKLYLERTTAADATRPAAAALLSGAGLTGEGAALDALEPLPAQIARDRWPEAQMPALCVLDDVSARYLSAEGGLPRALLGGQLALAARSGLPLQVCMIGDVLAGSAPQARFYLFPDLLTIAPEDGNRLGDQVARDGALLVWVYAPGAITEDLLTGRPMSYLTGIKLTLLDSRGPLQVRVEAFGSLPGSGLNAPLTYGLAEGAPRFFCADPAVEWLGTLVESTRRPVRDEDRPAYCGLALKRFAACTSVFSAAPLLPPEVLRGLAGRADLTAWADGRAGSWFGPGIAILEGATDGPRHLSLPERATLVDLRSGAIVADDRREVALDLAPGALGAFHLSFRQAAPAG